METNRHMNVLKIHTFPHNDVKESYLMQDFQKGQQITCFPSLYQCTFHEFRIENDTDTSLITAAIIQSMLNSKQTAKSTIRKELYHIDETEIGDTNILGKDLKQFYLRFGFPLFREKTLQHEAEILNQPNNTGTHFKRYS
ncbi:Hypothetical predicted protein [Mytilus galloprovincialis]|uniref:Uncharacterized protein n=1 Tax=Mytilus galloprovincialis TaxID=29158 RepID=A0A8B6F702_MYTGA|nr:Hypothetical predicted protein [Mytilus galloprovincialis]